MIFFWHTEKIKTVADSEIISSGFKGSTLFLQSTTLGVRFSPLACFSPVHGYCDAHQSLNQW